MPEMICPKCKSKRVKFLETAQIYYCKECENEFQPGKEHPHLRIFISYGRDEYAALAVRLKDDLIKRGHDVWFDSERLNEGGDWEQYIDEGLNHVAKDITIGRVVFIMTPHSTRRPDGYCLNELARALSKSLPIVPLMLVYSEPPLSICRLQYLDMQDSYPPDEKTVTYEQRFERLISALEENRLDFEGFQGRLLAALDPIKFHADIEKLLRDFTGRKWVIEEVDKWYADPDGSKIFWLTGAPGTGKSAVAAWIRDNRREIAAYHFCDINSEEKRDAGKLVRSIAFQLSTQLPQYEEKLKSLPVQEIANEYKEAYTLFDKLIVQPLTENFPDPGRTVVVLIDALDEATYKGNNEIVRFLSRCADKTPSWLRFLVTSRPEQEITSSLQALSPYLLDTDTEANRNDIMEYLKTQLPDITSEQTDRILELSEGVFLYVKHVCEEIKAKRLSLDRIDEFPKGLGDVYKQFFENRIPADRLDYYNQEIRPLLCAVLASFEPLTLGHLMRLLGKKNLMELFDVTDTLGSLFPRTGDSEKDTISPFHRSIKDWITVKASAGVYFIDKQYGHQILAEDGWRQYEAGAEKMDDYSLAWLPMHIAEIEDLPKLVNVLKNFEFMMARVKAGHIERLLADYREIVKELPSDVKSNLRIEEAFFREKAHILRRGYKDWPAYKILLQLAIEHADDSPLTIGAEKYLADGKVDWVWLRRENRPKWVSINPCLAVLEGHKTEVNPLTQDQKGISGVAILKDGQILSWACDGLRVWSADGELLSHMNHGYLGDYAAIELGKGQILSIYRKLDTTFRIWDTHGKLISESQKTKSKNAIQISGCRILSWSTFGTEIQIWDYDLNLLSVLEKYALDTEENCQLQSNSITSKTARLEKFKYHINEVCQLPSKRIMSKDRRGALFLWGEDGHFIAEFAAKSNALELSDGLILAWSAGNDLNLWDKDSHITATLSGHTGCIKDVIELRDGKILSWADDKQLRLWSKDGRCIAILEGCTGKIRGVSELNDGCILTWSDDKNLRIWHRDGKVAVVMTGHLDNIINATELSDGRILAWSERDIRCWKRDGSQLACLDSVKRIKAVFALSNGNIAFITIGKSCIGLWDIRFNTFTELIGHSDRINGICELPGASILSWSDDGTLRKWATNITAMNGPDGHTGGIEGIRKLSDGNILSWSSDTSLRIWDVQGNCISVLEGHKAAVLGAIELSNGKIMSWGQDTGIYLWSNFGKQFKAIHNKHLRGFLQKNQRGAIQLRDSRIALWDGSYIFIYDCDGNLIRTCEGHQPFITGVAELSSGRLLSWGSDCTLRLWSGDGEPIAVLKKHLFPVMDSCELRDGRIVSCSFDGAVYLWSADGVFIKELEHDEDCFESICALEDGRFLTFNEYMDIYLWSQNGDSHTLISLSEAIKMPGDLKTNEINGNRLVSRTLIGVVADHAIVLVPLDTPLPGNIFWHEDRGISRKLLWPDGRVVCSNKNGQLSFIRLCKGNKFMTIADYEQIL